MIAIVNVGPHDDPDKLGVRTYEVRINANVVCTFKHRRADGLGMCLLKASKLGIELKPSYYRQAVKNCAAAANALEQYEIPLNKEGVRNVR